MAITTHLTDRPPTHDGSTSAGSEPRTGPIRRIVAASLFTGLVAAAVLTLVVFAGAGEHAITVSALLGFALGWAMLAALSIRMTSQAQRWAFVPAAAMAVTGLGLLILAPGDAALTTAGWAWPPVLLTLAVWIVFRVRRSPGLPERTLGAVPGRGRHGRGSGRWRGRNHRPGL
jgi:hypothetical protein